MAVSLSIPSAAIGENGIWESIRIEGGDVVGITGANGPTTPIYAVGATTGVFRSTDGGLNWTGLLDAMRASGLNPFNASLVAANPMTPTHVFYADFSGLFKSTDSGETWTRLTTPPGRASSVVFHPTEASTVFATFPSGLHRSADAGVTWQSFDSVLRDTNGGPVFAVSLAIDPLNPATVYVAGSFDGLFVSRDSGATWSALNNLLVPGSLSISDIAIDPVTPTNVYAAGSTGIFASPDGGQTWAPLTDEIATTAGIGYVGIRTLAVSPTGTVIVALIGPDGDKVLASNDQGETWTLLGVEVLATYEAFAWTPNAILAATSSGVHASADGGTTWMPRNDGLHATLISTFLPLGAGNDLLAIDSSAGLFKSEDGGLTWLGINDGVPVESNSVAVATSEPTTIYRARSNQIFKSIDGGATWAPTIADTSPFDAGFGILLLTMAVSPTDPDTLLIGNNGIPEFGAFGDRSGIFSSSDGGETWVRVYQPSDTLSFFQLTGLAFDPLDPARILAGALVANNTDFAFDGSVLLSTDGGATWEEVLTGLGFPEFTFSPNAAFVTASRFQGLAGGAFRSDDRGSNWTEISEGLGDPPNAFSRVSFDPDQPDNLYLVLGGRVLTRSSGEWSPVDNRGAELSARTVVVLAGDPPTLVAGQQTGIARYTVPLGCDQDPNRACLNQGRFAVEVDWMTEQGASGRAQANPLPGGDSVAFTFFDPNNTEVLLKVLDACAFGHFWVFDMHLSNVEYTIRVIDGDTGQVRTIFNPQGNAAPSVLGTSTVFECDGTGNASEVVDTTTLAASPPPLVEERTDPSVVGPCVADETTICLNDGRFRVHATFADLQGGPEGPAKLWSLGDESSYATFFDDANAEMLIKVIDACVAPWNRYWVFVGGVTNVPVELLVEDSLTGKVWQQTNPSGSVFATNLDTATFFTECSP